MPSAASPASVRKRGCRTAKAVPRKAASRAAAEAATPSRRTAADRRLIGRTEATGCIRSPHFPEKREMWQPIASAETSRECWSTIHEIEHALSERMTAGDEVKRDDIMKGAYAGISLFYAYLHAAGVHAAAADRALEAIDLSTNALAEQELMP